MPQVHVHETIALVDLRAAIRELGALYVADHEAAFAGAARANERLRRARRALGAALDCDSRIVELKEALFELMGAAMDDAFARGALAALCSVEPAAGATDA